MRYYRCKCGWLMSWGSMPPHPCSKCEKCGSNLAEGPDLHEEPQEHDWVIEKVETDEGLKDRTHCRWCGRRKIEIEKAPK